MKRIALPVVAAVLLAGCGSSSTTPQTGATAPKPAASIDPNIDNGQRILITDGAFVPHWLVSIVDKDIVWVNETSTVQRIRFSNGTVDSGPIPPGKTFTYRPTDQVSIPYGSVGKPHIDGVVQVEPFLDPGETPYQSPQAGP
ncbi:MAG: hypothetical protein M3O84_02900 [Actinomycetota bacterium]|nr:hypothetical protein [Actinomycetota bacterium]